MSVIYSKFVTRCTMLVNCIVLEMACNVSSGMSSLYSLSGKVNFA